MNKQLKAVLISSLMCGATGAMAADASSVFQWTGTIPAAPISSGAVIVKTAGSIEHNAGTLVFQETSPGSATYDLVSSSQLGFNVELIPGNTPASSFDYELTSVKYSANGGLMTEGTAFAIQANGVDLVKGSPVTGQTSDVDLTVTTPTSLSGGGFVPSAEVVVHATILASNVI